MHAHTHYTTLQTDLQVAYPQKMEPHLGHFQEGAYQEESVVAVAAVVAAVDLQLEQVLVVVAAAAVAAAAQLVQGELLVPLAVDISLLVYPVCDKVLVLLR